jgi:hypothetical protein
MSIETDLSALKANGRTNEIFALMKIWEDLKLKNHFSESALRRMKEKGTEFTLDRDKWPNRAARQVKYGPEQYVSNIDGIENKWTYRNTFDSQPLRISLKSMPRLADYGDPENKVLLRPGPLRFETSIQGPFGRGRNSEGTELNLSISKEQVKIGGQSFEVTALNDSENPDGWACVEIVLDEVHDMRGNRAIGTWVYGDGSGVPLHFVVEDAGRWAVRDWWVRLDFEGWKYVVIPEPAEGEVYGFNYPYSSYWSIRHINYSKMARVYVFLTNIPPKQSVRCFFTQLEALKERPSIIKNPKITVGRQSIMFPVNLETEHYLESMGGTNFRVFDSNGFTIAEKDAQNSVPTVQSGDNAIEFDCDFAEADGQAAKVEIITLGEPFR